MHNKNLTKEIAENAVVAALSAIKQIGFADFQRESAYILIVHPATTADWEEFEILYHTLIGDADRFNMQTLPDTSRLRAGVATKVREREEPSNPGPITVDILPDVILRHSIVVVVMGLKPHACQLLGKMIADICDAICNQPKAEAK